MLKANRWLKGAVVPLLCVVVVLGLGLSLLLAPQPVASERSPQAGQSLPVAQLSAPASIIDQPIVPITTVSDVDPKKAALGNRLFHDPQLSGNNKISCASCHNPDLGGADGRAKSLGFEEQLSALNAPTVWNSSLNFRQFWDGRAATLEAQIDEPILNPKEMNSSWPSIVSKLTQNNDYVSAFRQLYPTGIQSDSIRDAIAAYERTLVTPNSRFDQYLLGNQSAVTASEKAGYDLFKDYGCVACHQGVNVGGNMFQRLGVMQDFFKARGDIQTADLGRMNISGRLRDRYVFKVPSLRNVELTAPYLHDGSVESLAETIGIMGRYQLGREIPPEDVNLLVQFLRTLTGEVEAAAL